jgi:hypothetical protein
LLENYEKKKHMISNPSIQFLPETAHVPNDDGLKSPFLATYADPSQHLQSARNKTWKFKSTISSPKFSQQSSPSKMTLNRLGKVAVQPDNASKFYTEAS